MFSEKGVRNSTSPTGQRAELSNSGVDFNRLFMQHQKDISLLQNIPSMNKRSRKNSAGSNVLTRSATNLRSLMRRRDSASIETAALLSADREKDGSLNVIVAKKTIEHSDNPILFQPNEAMPGAEGGIVTREMLN